ncbi:MAG: aspartate--tRNA ligase [Spirochaetaceae bacterium]
MDKNKRTLTCGEPTAAHCDTEVILNGWVHRVRDHGGIRFFNLRDRYGQVQVVIDTDAPEAVRETGSELKLEYCVAVVGIVRRRPDSMVNPDMASGEIEIQATSIDVLSSCEPLPFMIEDRSDAREETRLKYRYLDLRSASMQRKIRLRHEVTWRVREYLNGLGFYEIETPTMIKSTPEGARDFLIPSRLHPGSFYAMPQSPQLYKQILMVSGFDRYFQIAHCFRDEDARGDRQLEHTQIDIEMSFVSAEDVFELVEGMMNHVFTHAIDHPIPTPFLRLSYRDAMNRYGTDKPDLRFDLHLQDAAELAQGSGFRVFEEAIASGGAVKALAVPGGARMSRKEIESLEAVAKTYGAKGLAWLKMGPQGPEGGISKFFADAPEAVSGFGVAEGDLLLFVADTWKVACTALGAVRSSLGKTLDLIDRSAFAFAWVVDFPLFEWNEDDKRWEAAHHMFTMPQEQFIDTLESDPGAVNGDLYDLVCNGFELASGSIRIHNAELQSRIFDIVGFSREEAQKRFGFLLDAFRYGPPPHGGIAPGLDRLVMIMAGEQSIREVIAFPKTTNGMSPMDESPSEVDPDQLKDLGIQIIHHR